MTQRTSQERIVSRKGLALLAVMGIIGLFFLAFGVFSIFEISIVLGLVSLVLGFVIYSIFIIVERKLKLL